MNNIFPNLSYVLIGLISSIIILFAYKIIEKDENYRINYFFIVMVLFISFIVKPSENIWLWLGLVPMMYVVLDDIKTKMVSTRFPIVVTLFFVVFTRNPYPILISIVFFFIILFVSEIKKEKGVGVGDAYFIFPLVFLLSDNANFIKFNLFLFLESIFATMNYLILSSLMALIYVIVAKEYQKKRKDIIKTEMYFTPFLFFGFIFYYHDYYVKELFGVIIFVLLVYLIYNLLFKMIKKLK